MNLSILKYLVLPVLLIQFSASVLKAQPGVTFTPTNITCYGANNAKMQMDVTSGSGSYFYICLHLKTPALNDTIGPTSLTSYTFNNLLPNPADYLFRVVDEGTGLETVQYYQFSQLPVLTGGVTGTTNINCYDAKTGVINITGAGGGSGQLDYTIDGWSTFKTTPNFTSLGAGIY